MSLPTKSLCLLVCLCISSAFAHNAYGQEDSVSAIEAGFRKYAIGLFKKYDVDESESLDAEEISKMRRKPPIDTADLNEDGLLSVNELAKYYLAKNNPKQARKKVAAHKAKAKAKSSRSVAINVWVVKRSGRMDVQKLKGLSKEDLELLFSKVGEDSSMQIEEYHIETLLDRSFKIVRGIQVPVIDGMSRSRNGQAINSISKYDVGTKLTAMATQNGKSVLIDFAVTTSSVEDSEVSIGKREDKDILAQTIQTFEVEAAIECESGKAAVIQSKEKNGSWALIFYVDVSSAD
jgi:hypothetical protein